MLAVAARACREPVGQPLVAAQAHAGGDGLREREPAARTGPLGRLDGATTATATATVVVLGRPPGGCGVRAQEHGQQQGPEAQRDKVQQAEDDHQFLVRAHHLPGYPRTEVAQGVRYHAPPIMATLDTATLDLTTRSETGSRAMRRLRRTGRVPGILYGGDDQPVQFEVDARILRNTLAHAGALLQVTLDGGGNAVPVQIKDVQRHAVRGEIVHADFVRVDMKVAIQAPIHVELLGVEEAEGVVQGGVLTQETTQLNVEALPGDMPEVIQFDASGMQVADTVTVGQIQLPDGVTLVDDPELVLATITMPSEEIEATDEIETEVGLVGEEAEAQAEGDTAEEAEQSAGESQDAPGDDTE